MKNVNDNDNNYFKVPIVNYINLSKVYKFIVFNN